MIYIEYHEYKNKYLVAQKEYDKILSEKERLFSKTQPASTDYSKEPTTGGEKENAFDVFVISMEEKQIDAKLAVARSILEDREKLFKLKEEELKQSKEWLDIIYACYFVDKLSIRKISKKIPFSTTEIFRKIKIIRKNINLEQKGTKDIVQ